MLYFIADTHFFHKNILKLNPQKRKPGFEKKILKNLSEILKPEDYLFVIGDFIWEFRKEFVNTWRSIPGRKFLVKGNHDEWIEEDKLCLFFEKIYSFHTLVEAKEKRLLLCHYAAKDLRTRRFSELQHKISELYHSLNCSLLLHGHVHWNPYGVFCGCHLKGVKCVNVNVEFTNYKPVSLEELPIW